MPSSTANGLLGVDIQTVPSFNPIACMLNQNLGVIERLTSPTPSIFRTIRNISLVLAAIGASIAQLHTQMVLPDWLLLAGDKSVWISGLLTALVSQLTVDYTTKAIMDATSEKAEKGYLR